jgi:hypothetical protein
MRVCVALALLGCFAAPARAEERDESWWRAAATAHASEIEASEEALAACEEREAPPAYDGVDGYVTRSRGDGRLRWVEVKRCDEERADLDAARTALERFEDEARRLEVPPGWLR